MENKEEKYENAAELNESQAPENAEMKPAAASEPAVQSAAVSEPAAQLAAQSASAGKAVSWGEKNVTRKFLAIALAVALALNIALTAGVSKLLRPGRGFDKGRSGRPGNEQQFDNHGNKGNMMPPAGNQQPGGQQAQPDQQPGGQQAQPDQQPESQQNGNQQQDDQSSSDQKDA